jgi:integrase
VPEPRVVVAAGKRQAAGEAVRDDALGKLLADAHDQRRDTVGDAWQDNDLVFPNTIGKPVEAGNFLRRHYRPLLKRLDLPPVRFHDLCHTAATLLLLQSVHPKVVSEMLGHASVSITLDLYSHVLPDMQRDAMEAMARLFAGVTDETVVNLGDEGTSESERA